MLRCYNKVILQKTLGGAVEMKTATNHPTCIVALELNILFTLYIMTAARGDQITIKACEVHPGSTSIFFHFHSVAQNIQKWKCEVYKEPLLKTLRRWRHVERRDADLLRDEFSGMQSSGGGGSGYQPRGSMVNNCMHKFTRRSPRATC